MKCLKKLRSNNQYQHAYLALKKSYSILKYTKNMLLFCQWLLLKIKKLKLY